MWISTAFESIVFNKPHLFVTLSCWRFETKTSEKIGILRELKSLCFDVCGQHGIVWLIPDGLHAGVPHEVKCIYQLHDTLIQWWHSCSECTIGAPMSTQSVRCLLTSSPRYTFTSSLRANNLLAQLCPEITAPYPVQVNKPVLLDGGHDVIFSVGQVRPLQCISIAHIRCQADFASQVVPHEVAGMANHTKNILVGTGGLLQHSCGMHPSNALRMRSMHLALH